MLKFRLGKSRVKPVFLAAQVNAGLTDLAAHLSYVSVFQVLSAIVSLSPKHGRGRDSTLEHSNLGSGTS